MKYHSRISQRDEYLPVVVSLLGPPGKYIYTPTTTLLYIQLRFIFSCFDEPKLTFMIFNNTFSGSDMALINAAQQCLKKAGRPTRVITGPGMF